MIRPALDVNRSLRVLAALVCACVCAGPASAQATDGLERIRGRGLLVVSVKNDGNPDRAAHKDPAHFQKRAFELELAREVAAALLGDPSRVEFRMMPKPARIAALLDGRVDLVISMLVPDAAMRERVDFSRPYYALGTAVMHRADGPSIRRTADLTGLRLGLIERNDANPRVALDAAAGNPARIASFESFDAAAAAIARGDIDGLLSEAVNIDTWLAAHPDGLARSPALSHAAVAIAVPKGSPALLAGIDALLERLAASGRLADMQRAQGLLPAD